MAPVGNNPALDQVIDAMLKVLKDYLPQPIAGLPFPGVAVASVSERAVGLNNYIGTGTRGAFPIVSRRGIRLDALVRFQIWADDPVQIDTTFSNLDAHLMADRNALLSSGFLRLALENTVTADQVASLNAWRKQADYRILYEFRFQDADDARGLIARIQIDSVPEESNLLPHETTNVTDRMARWDNLSAPPFVVRGRFNVGGLAALQFIAGTVPSGTITLTRTVDGMTGPPTMQPTLQDFLVAVAGPNAPERHSQVIFPSLKDFLSNFSSAGDPVVLGDWDGNNVPDSYAPLFLSIDPAIQLPSVFDHLELSYQGKAFDQIAVVYLRATGG
jgi:hypothetical protein